MFCVNSSNSPERQASREESVEFFSFALAASEFVEVSAAVVVAVDLVVVGRPSPLEVEDCFVPSSKFFFVTFFLNCDGPPEFFFFEFIEGFPFISCDSSSIIVEGDRR
jgi:hypothetical protein